MAASRARSGQRIHIWELPFSVLNTISIILDTNNKWKELVTPLGFSITDLYRFERCNYQPGASASQTMIVEWGQQNHTIDELFCVLSGLQQRRAMALLEKFVNPELYYRLMSNDELPTRNSPLACAKEEEFYKTTDDDDDLPKPPKPSLVSKQKRMPVQETEYGSARSPSMNSNAHSKQNGSHELDFQFSKLNVDPQNLNQPDSNSPLPSKMPLNSFFPSPSNASVNPCSQLPRPPLPKVELQQPTSLSMQHADESIEDNTKFPSTSPSSHLERAENIWQHSHQENRRPSDASSSKSRGTPSFAADSMLTSIQYDAIVAATEDFAPDKIIGRGGFGVVYAGCWKNTKVAIKRIVKETNPGSTSLEDAKLQQSYAELQTLYKYRHDNILALYGYSEQEDGLCLVYQFMVNGSLEDRLLRKNNTPPLTWRQRLHIARGSACGIQFLHTCDIKPIIHGDIKSANILLDVNLEPKIGDFGLAREGPSSESTHRVVSAVHGTQPYLPMDYIRNRCLSTKVDTYSFGIVLFELATGLRAYDGERKRNLRNFVMDCDKMKYDNLRDRSAGDEWADAFLTFIHTGCQCAAPKKKDRPEMVQVLAFLENKLHSLAANEIPVQNISESTEQCNASFKTNLALANDLPPLSLASEEDTYSDSAQGTSQSSLSLNETSIKENNCDIAPPVAYPNIPNLTALGTKQPS